MMPPTSPTLTVFCHRTYAVPTTVTPRNSAIAATNALFVHTCAANDWAGWAE